MASRLLVFHPQDIYNLFCHYTDGAVPLNGEVLKVGISPLMQRMLGFEVRSEEWREEDLGDPFVVVFEGRKTATFDEKGQPVRHGEMNDNPRRQ